MADERTLQEQLDSAHTVASWCANRLRTIGESKLTEPERMAVHVVHSLAIQDVAATLTKMERSSGA
jgi:hypothetical protein